MEFNIESMMENEVISLLAFEFNIFLVE